MALLQRASRQNDFTFDSRRLYLVTTMTVDEDQFYRSTGGSKTRKEELAMQARNVIVMGASLLCAVGCGASQRKIAPDGKEVDIGEVSSALSPNDNLTQIAVEFETGGDDKRSDSQVFFNAVVNGFTSSWSAGGLGTTWPNWSWTGWFFGNLPAGTLNSQISNFTVTWTPGGGGFIQTGDNWNMEAIDVWVWDQTLGGWQFKGQPGGDPLQRFTGNTRSWSWGGWPP